MDLRNRLLSQSVVLFASRVFGAGLIFAAQAAIARFWGASVLGEYLLVIAVANILAVGMPLGFQTVGTYFAAEYRARGRGQALNEFMSRAYGHVLICGALVTTCCYPLTSFLGEPGRVVAEHWLPACLMAIATAVVYCNSALLVGLKRPLAGFFADTIVRPLLIVACIAIAGLAIGADARLEELIWLLALGFAAIAAGQHWWVRRAALELPPGPEATPGDAARWWRFALPWAVVALATDFFFDIDLLLLSGLLDREALAVFGVLTRVFSLAAFGVAAVYAVVLPDMLASNASSDRAAFARQVGDANLMAGVVSAGLFVAVLLGGPTLMLLFGPEFSVGAMPLAVLCLALCVRSVFGPAALVLSLHDRPYATLPAIGLGMGVLIGANLLLVPIHGLLGAAVAGLAAQTFWSAAMWLTVRRLAGIDVSILPRFKAFVARGVAPSRPSP